MPVVVAIIILAGLAGVVSYEEYERAWTWPAWWPQWLRKSLPPALPPVKTPSTTDTGTVPGTTPPIVTVAPGTISSDMVPINEARAQRLIQLAGAYAWCVKRYRAEIADQAAGAGLSAESQANINSALKITSGVNAGLAAIAGAIAAGSAAVPFVGQVAGAIAAIVAFVAGIVNALHDPRTKSEMEQGINIYGGAVGWDGGSYFVGWLHDAVTPGCYFWRSIPVFGGAIDEFERQMGDIAGTWERKGWIAFLALVRKYPMGPPVDSCEVYVDGSYHWGRGYDPSWSGSRNEAPRSPMAIEGVTMDVNAIGPQTAPPDPASGPAERVAIIAPAGRILPFTTQAGRGVIVRKAK